MLVSNVSWLLSLTDLPSSDSESFNPSLWEEQRKQRAQVAFECDEDKDERETPTRVSSHRPLLSRVHSRFSLPLCACPAPSYHPSHPLVVLFCAYLALHTFIFLKWYCKLQNPSHLKHTEYDFANGANCSSYNKKLIIIKMSLQLVDWYRFSMLEMLFFPLQMTYSKLNTIKRFCNYLLILMSFQILMTFIVLWNTKADILWLCWPLFFMQLLLMSFEWMLKGKVFIT